MKYHNSKIAHKNEEVIDRLLKNNNIIIIKQGKGRGLNILDRSNILISSCPC